MPANPRTLYVNLRSKGRDLHEFFIGDRWHRITGPPGSSKTDLERILRQHLSATGTTIPEGITITSR